VTDLSAIRAASAAATSGTIYPCRDRGCRIAERLPPSHICMFCDLGTSAEVTEIFLTVLYLSRIQLASKFEIRSHLREVMNAILGFNILNESLLENVGLRELHTNEKLSLFQNLIKKQIGFEYGSGCRIRIRNRLLLIYPYFKIL
jgi:hypothetical protein